MATTQQDEVRERRRATVGPVHDVVGVGPRVRPVAAGEPASPIPHDQGSADRRRDDLGPSADVEWLRRSRQHDARHGGVAAEAPSDLDRHGTYVVGLG
jgi:hypothetical protein